MSSDEVLRVWTFPKWSWALGTLLLSFCVISAIRSKGEDGRQFVIAVVAGIAFLSLLIDVTRRKVLLTTTGLTMVSPWGRPKSILYEHIAEVRPGLTLDIVSRDGTTIRIPDHLGNREHIQGELAKARAKLGLDML